MSDLDHAKFCFIPDDKDVFTIAEITQRDAEKKEVVVSVLKTKKVATLKYDVVVPIGSMEELDNPPTDLTKLVYVNRPGILHTLRARFMQDRIYTSIGPILVALNPFKWISGVYEESIMLQYKNNEASLTNNPHVFAVSQDAYCDLSLGQNQSLIISGESGAGKTEATKQCLSYLAFLAGSATGIQTKILKASPILEAWGNAKTLRNNNSSRFGKFIEIWFDGSRTITGSSNTTYILEKSRVVFQEKDERNYHVFYQLLKGGPADLLQDLELSELAAHPETAMFINQSGCIDIENVDDAADFREVNEAFAEIGFTLEEQQALYTIIAGILHFGNIAYEANPENNDESLIQAQTLPWLDKGARRFGVDIEFARKALLYKQIRSGGANSRRTSVAYASYKLEAAYESRNALCKEIYRRCFDYIVARINSLMGNDRDQAVNMIGILDIFGFEIFKKNSFEQLCINLANEALQQHFNYNIFQAEMDVYVMEDVPVPPLEYRDNQDVLDLIVKRPIGLIPMLDEEGLVPRGSWEGFLSKFTKQHAKHPRSKKTKLVHELGIVHYAGDVFYDATLFLIKNKDTLSADLVDVFSASTLPLLRQLFTESPEQMSITPESSSKRTSTQSASKMTVGKSFSLQLEKLIADLNSTNPRYIRCIKPNQVKKPNIFMPDLTNEQLTYSGVFEAVIIMQNGYPFRLSHLEFRSQYHMLVQHPQKHALLFDSAKLDEFTATGSVPSLTLSNAVSGSFTRDQCKFMVSCLCEEYPGRGLEGCFPGKTRTFYRSMQHNALMKLRTVIVDHAALLLQKCGRAYCARRLTRAIRRAENEWFASLSTRKTEVIAVAAEKVDGLVVRLNKCVSGLGFQLDCSQIGRLYGRAFESEDQLLPAIQAALQEQVDIMKKYDRLEKMLQGLDTVNFTVKYRAASLSFKWEDKAELKDCAEKIAAMGELVKVKRKFLSGISGKNEVALEEAVKELQSLRDAGKIEEDFCVDEAVQAQKIITEAEMLFVQLLSSVAAAITAGRFTMIGTGRLAEREVSVDVGALNVLISAHERDMTTKSADALPPIRVRSLQLLCKQLRDIRVLARDQKWDELWSDLQTHWSAPTAEVVGIGEFSGFHSCENFLPADLKAGILQEKREMSLAAITFCVVPQVQSAIDRNQVPSVPTLSDTEEKSALVDTTELSAQIASAEKYTDSFDQDLLEFLDLAKEHLFYRQEVASRDWTRISALMQRGSIIPPAHPDRANVKNFVRMFDTVAKIKERLLEDKVSGAPGSFEFASIEVDGLSIACNEAAVMAVRGKAWLDLLEVAKTVCRVRESLQKMEFTEAWEFMQSLSSSEPWQAIVTSAVNGTADPSVLDALSSSVEELQSYGAEILHARAMKDISQALASGGIGDGNSNFSTTNISTAALQAELDSKSSQLIVTDAAHKLLENCKVVQRLRSLALTSQWSEVERVILALGDPKQGFQDCHANCKAELQRYYHKVYDLKVCAALESAMATGKIRLLSEGEHQSHRCDVASVDTVALKGAVDYAKQGHVLSVSTRELLSMACGLYCLRSVLVADYWEPRRRFFFADTSTEYLAGQMSTMDSDPALAKARHSLATTITTLSKLESEVELEFTTKQPLISRGEVSALSVVEVLVHLRKSLSVGSAIEAEIEVVEVLSRERRCMLMLLLSAFIGRIKGSLDDFDFSDVVTNFIEAAIEYVQDALEGLGAAPVLRNWMLAAQYLLSVRRTILRATAEHPDSEPILSEVFQVQDLQDILATITPGYPVQELKLVLNKLKDQTTFQELLRALGFGQPVFEEGKLDVNRVQHAHLVERLETAKKNHVRSDRLDRLFFYVELTIRLRTAIGLGQWELSDREKSNSDGANAMITVKRCLREMEQARRFFSTPVPGVPPPVVIDEFRLIGREWERRLVKQRFGAAFKSGAITGQPLSLSLTGLRTELLEAEIARMKEAQAVATEKDASFELYMQAGTELVSIRKEAAKIQASYRHPTKFSYPSDSLHTILDAPDFIPDAISCALAGVQGAIAQPYRFAEEWKPIDVLLAGLQGCPEIPATQEEVRLVTTESRDRAYIVAVLGAFNSAAGVLRSPRSAQELIDSLISAQDAYDESLQQGKMAATASTHWRSNRTVRQNRVLEMLHSSAVVLIHFLRAHSENTFDSYDRDWTEDKNNTRTPRLFTLSANLTASHSMQQILRCASQISLHPHVQNLVTAATMRLEDAISKQEMLQSLTDVQYVYTGTVGNIKTNTMAVPFLKYVLERLDRVGVKEHSVEKMRAYCTVHQELRRSVLHKDYIGGFAVLDDFLGNGKRSLQFVLQVMANKNYQVTAEAHAEFLLMAQDICDRAWLDLAKLCVVTDRVRGKRGALHVTEIGWQEVDRALAVYDALPAVSPLSAHMHIICELVKTLRSRLLGSGEYFVETQQIDSSDSKVAFQKLEFAKKRSEFGAVAPKVLDKLADQLISSACLRVASISASNVTWQRLDNLATFSQFVQPIVDALHDRVDLDGALEGPFKTDLLEECDLVNRHCESLQAGVTLEAALESELAFLYSSDGLSIKKDSSGRLVRTLAGATAQRWQLLGHPEEYWWASLTALSKSFLSFIDQGGALVTGTTDVFILRPGTEHFKTMLFTMYALIAQVNNIVQQLKTIGYRKRASLPSSILSARDRMRAAIVEHNCLVRLERIISAECIVTSTAEDTQLLRVDVVHVHAVLLVEKDEELPRSVDFEQYGRDIKAMIAVTRVDTTLGKLLVDMLQQLVELRMAVAGKHWYQAKQLCATFHWIPDFASSRDIEECQRFLRYKEYHRAIESAILSCSLPSIVGWSLHALSRDIALNINDRTLRELVAPGQAKYGNLSVQYLALSQLLIAGEKLLEIVSLVRKGLWVGSQKYSDEISGGLPWEGSRYISVECRGAPASLRALVHASPALATHMRKFLLQTASNLDTELTVVQLEHSIQKTLRTVQLTGKPGELIVPEGVSFDLQAMCERISSVGTMVQRSHSFRAADQAAKIYQKFIDAHLGGNLGDLVKYYDLMRYLSEIDCRPGELSVVTALRPTSIEEDDILKAKDVDFAAEIAAQAAPCLLPDAGQGPLHLFEEGRSSRTGKYWDTAYLSDKSELQKAFVLCTGYAFSDAVALRAEVYELLSLLHSHVAIENMYVDYLHVVAVTEDIGEPGALDAARISTEALSGFIAKYSPFAVQSPRIPPHIGHTLLEMARGLLTVRQGQIANDTALIAVGLEQAGAACAKENEYEILSSAVVFGGAVRNCFEHIAEEVELADEDMQQRRLMDQLRLALAFPGLPTTGFPYYISGIRVEALDEAYDACNITIPACAEARRLYQAASFLLVLRKYALRRDWTAMITFLDSLEVENLETVFVESGNMAEFTAAREVMLVSKAIELAIESYIAGYIGGTVGAIAPCGDIFFNAKEPKSSIAVFEKLDPAWINAPVRRHYNTVETLFAIRSNASMRKWEEVLEAASIAAKGAEIGTRPIVEICLPEVLLARDHAAYVLSLKHAKAALSIGALRGVVGDAHTWQVEIDTLQEAYRSITIINCRRSDILRYKAGMELLFRLRRAILLDQWFSPDITHDYLHLLGSNFQLQPERVQHKALYARLVDQSLVEETHEKPTATEKDAATFQPEEAGQEVPLIETVQSIMASWTEFKGSGVITEDAFEEVELAHKEVRHRSMVALLLKNIHTAGIQGAPGQVDTSQAVTRLLEKAIVTASENSDVSLRGDCKGLLRDAKLLLMARRYRINEQWLELHHMLEEIELTLSTEAATEEATASDDATIASEEMVVKEYVRSIVKPVWQELQLLKYDCLFQLSLTNFRTEMTRPAPPPPPSSGPGMRPLHTVVISQEHIEVLLSILEYTEAAALEYPSPDFARLVEAEAAAVELRKFCQQNPNKSPQEIIHLVAQTKRKDEEAGLTSYMALLIHEISQMANVLDFPVNLKTIHREILKGQKYLGYPIGQLETSLIDIEVMTVAYNAALSSLELFGTEHDHDFMALAEVVIRMRGALLRNGLNAAIAIIDSNEEILQSPLMREEVDRLRIEKENVDAGRLMEIGLKSGRYIDVLSIARMVYNYEYRIAGKAAAVTAVDSSPLANFGPEAKRASRRAQRVSREVASSSSRILAPDSSYSSETDARSRRGHGSTVYGGKRRSVQVEEGTASEEFIEGVFKSINALNRAIAIALQVRVRSANTDFYLNAVQVILRLRENLVADNWDEVRAYLDSEENWQDLPDTALDEVQACREGLVYRDHIVRLSRAFYVGAIYGAPHEIDYDDISCSEVSSSLETCRQLDFSDPSAVLMMEFAQRLVTVRQLLLADEWVEAEHSEEISGSLDFIDQPSKLRKSIYAHHAVPPKHTAQKLSVDSCVKEFVDFQAVALPKLQALFKVSSQIESVDRVDMDTVVQEAQLVLLHKPDHAPDGSTPDDWLTQIWHAVLHVVLEINLAQQVTQYRAVLLRLIDAADSTPEIVRAYVAKRHHLHPNIHPLLRHSSSSHHHDDISLYGSTGLDMPPSNPGNYGSGLDVAELEEALQRARDYLSFVGFETSEDMLRLQETCKLLVDFRLALREQKSHDLMLQLMMRAKSQASNGFLSSENGIFELNAYINSTAESARIQNGLRSAMQSKHASGPLNALIVKEISTAELQECIDDAFRFLARGGGALSVGVSAQLLQARVIHKLRSALRDGEWSVMEHTLRKYETQAGDWESAGLEFQHIKKSVAFRSVTRRLRHYINDFHSEDDLGHSLMCLRLDLEELRGIFAEINSLLQYSSPLLQTDRAQHYTSPESCLETPQQPLVISAEFFRLPTVVSCYALWRLFQALQSGSWYVKQAIHDCESQVVAVTVDPFLYAFFGVGESNYASNVRHELSAADVRSGCGVDNATVPALTVFSVLISTHWADFPFKIRSFFNRVRNRLIDSYVRADLKYYCNKGATNMDSAGNLRLSSISLQFLKITLADALKATDLARSLCVKFRWTPETEKWLESAQTALSYRQTLISGGHADTIVELLRKDGLMRGHSVFDPKLFSIHSELEVVEKYAQAHVAERTAHNALQFLATHVPDKDFDFSDSALENVAVLELCELASAPIPVAEPSAYLLDMLHIVCLTRDAIFAAMLGGQARFLSIVECLRESVAFHAKSSLGAVNMSDAVATLSAACKRAYHAELQDLAYTAKIPHIERKFARVVSSVGHRRGGDYLSENTQSSAPASPKKMRPKISSSTELGELTGMARLTSFTERILTALCELLYFHQDEEFYSVGARDQHIEKLRRMVPTSPRSQAPYQCFLNLCSLVQAMDEMYGAYEPRWAAALLIAVFYLSKEAGRHDDGVAAAASMVNLSQDLVQFCRDIQLDRAVLAAHVLSAPPRAGVKGQRRGQHRSTVDIDTAPSLLMLVKHLTSIRMNCATPPWAQSELKSGFEKISLSALEAAQHLSALSLENTVNGEKREARAALLRELPIGAVTRAVAQSNVLLKTFD